jgi:nitrite reductase (NO-forming)
MPTRFSPFATLSAAIVVGAGAVALLDASRGDTIERIDFGVTRVATSPAYDARLAPATDANVREFIIPITHDTIEIAGGVKYEGWTFGGTVPGPVLRVREGDRVRITLVNESDMPHSIDLHAARIAMDEAMKTIPPGGEVSFEFVARDPGAFMVHCGTPPVLMHIMQGMYMAIIVEPRGGWGTDADREFVLLQSEFYAKDGPDGVRGPDWQAAQAKQPSFVVFNGRAFQYKAHPLQVGEGERVRFFVVNAGPSLTSDFHIVGTIFDRVYPDGNPGHVLNGVQTWPIPAGGGAVFETTFAGPGTYAFVTHSFADAEKGAVGLIRAGNAVVADAAH